MSNLIGNTGTLTNFQYGCDTLVKLALVGGSVYVVHKHMGEICDVANAFIGVVNNGINSGCDLSLRDKGFTVTQKTVKSGEGLNESDSIDLPECDVSVQPA
jgi:hypothetical protein